MSKGYHAGNFTDIGDPWLCVINLAVGLIHHKNDSF